MISTQSHILRSFVMDKTLLDIYRYIKRPTQHHKEHMPKLYSTVAVVAFFAVVALSFEMCCLQICVVKYQATILCSIEKNL